ncbi:hypothetical protein TNCV_1672991 [Trichonephila clavipes]|nr:hypothetical protein TNCV_1672991 [Trichonephila clavipes]
MNLRSSQLMGDLLPIRFQQIRPFESTGLDFAGPLTTKCAHKRTALRRFIARRSCPSKIISDNGSNFKDASSHLRKLVDLCLQEMRLVLTQDLSQSSLRSVRLHRIDSSPLLEWEVLFISFQNHPSPQGLYLFLKDGT